MACSVYRFLFLVMAVAVVLWPPSLSHAAEGGSADEERATRFLFREFNEIKYFGMIAVSLVGQAEQLGLRSEEITLHAKKRFRDYFAGIRLEDVSSDSKKFLSLVLSRDKTVGNITFRIWVLGEDRPVVYHIKCDAGNFDNPSIWTEETLGHAARANLEETVLGVVDEMLKTLAVAFLKVRSHAM